MLHVAIFLADVGGGGAERMMVNLASMLNRHGLKVDLVLAAAKGAYMSSLPKDLTLIDLKAGRATRSLPKLTGYLKSHQPDVLITTLYHSSLISLLANYLAGGKTRVFLREATTPSAVNAKLKSLKGRFIIRLMHMFYPRADKVIAVSRSVAKDLQGFYGLKPEKILMLYNPVVTAELKEKAQAPLEHPWFAEGAPPVVLSAGRLSPEKDYSSLIKAFKTVRESHEARLMILGEGKEREHLEALIKELGLEKDVALPGFVDNPFAYMSKASLYVLSSLREGLPGALIQAMACGCPVVATDCPSGPAEVLEDGRYGELVPVSNPLELAKAIKRTLDHPLASDILKERSECFSDTRVVGSYLEALEAV